MRSRASTLLACAIAVLASTVDPAGAEWAIDFYGGASWTQSADLRVTGRDDTGASVQASIFDIATDTGWTAGLRAGYWLDSLPFLGLGLDVFYFSIPIPSQTTSATGTLNGEILGKPISIDAAGQARVPSVTLPGVGFSPDIRLRLPLLTSDAAPQGRLQPYLTGGPAWAFTLKGNEVDVVFGGKVGAGLSVVLVRPLALFAEYRYTFFPDFTFSQRDLSFKADLNTHNAVVGVSLRF
ncbi:MAG TPA: outer membrane beta-barrel protein [Methylomirabilota bacterium]|jgi:opacity protein-like surface antigen